MSATLSEALIERKARELWDHMQYQWPAFVRQRWEQGTALARGATLARAEAMLRGRPDPFK